MFKMRQFCRLARGATGAVAVLTTMIVGCQPRTIDGTDNNPIDPSIGSAGVELIRALDSDYGDGASSLAGAGRPSPRQISNIVVAQPGPIPNELGASDFIWQWGQFMDHDLDLSEEAHPAEPAPIPVPLDDLHFPPGGEIGFNRSAYAPGTGTDPGNPRQQVNVLTAWIDGSQVYGSDPVRAAALRTNDGTGRLKTSAGNLLPFNDAGLPNGGPPDKPLFLAGDVRANEVVGLTCLHTLFMREHNWLADQIRSAAPHLDGDTVYELARAIVGAEIQVITFEEFLPVLLGPDALPRKAPYKPRVDASIRNSFATAAFRVGHTLLNAQLLRLDANGDEIPEGHLMLRDAFFAPERVIDEGGIEPILRGLASQAAQRVDPYIVDDVRNFLFGPPGAGGFDLASLNIQRGRDHGLPSYNDARVGLGLPAVTSFADISSDPVIQARLAAAYGDVNDIDLWVGGLSEDHVSGGLVGELFFTIIKNQFEALRKGDRYWYQRRFHGALRHAIESTRLSDVIRRNTSIDDEIQDDVFHVAP